jgi:2,3-bisphosphoglycerate-dependent phosphoglycerate mutase
MDLEFLNKKYGEGRVVSAIKKLSYKEVSTMPKAVNELTPTVYIFRHGESTDNKDMIFSGWRDVGLTKKGEEQALELSEILKNKKIDIIISSTQKRAIDTMKLAVSKNKRASKLPLITDPRLRERSYGDLEGASKLELFLEDEDLCQEYRRSYYKKARNGESLEEVVHRVKEFIEELIPLMKKEKINVAISCHGNSIRGFRKYFENLSDEKTAQIETPLGVDYISYNIQ